MWKANDFEITIKDIFERYIRYFRDCKEKYQYNLDIPLRFMEDNSPGNLISDFIKKICSKRINEF